MNRLRTFIIGTSYGIFLAAMILLLALLAPLGMEIR